MQGLHMAIAKERYVTSLMCLKAVTPALVQASTFGIMFTAFVVSQIDFSIVVQFQGEVPSVVHHVRPQ